MNYIIGMCKKHKDWISILADLGYEPQVIEQQIRTASDEIVKPDIITASNKLLHAIVFECKGGTTLDLHQLNRYSALTSDDLRRWVTVFAPKDLGFDLCISDLAENHALIAQMNKDFPMITFSVDKVFKTGRFKEGKLNDTFREPISLKGRIPPLLYYPFCEEDEDTYIALFVMRGLISIAVKNAKGGPSAFDDNVIALETLIQWIFNPVFEALSKDHQRRLREKIKENIHGIMAREDMKEALEIIERQAAVKIARPLEKFTKEAGKYIAFLETQRPLSEFMSKQKPSS